LDLLFEILGDVSLEVLRGKTVRVFRAAQLDGEEDVFDQLLEE
jgi:hypothetical protein